MFSKNFGIHPVAMAILTLVEDLQYKSSDRFFKVETYPWYNGREKGVCLLIGSFGESKVRFIVFGEERRSDSIFVDSWQGERPYNQPVSSDLTEEAYRQRKTFVPDDLRKAADYIHDMIEEEISKHCDAMKKFVAGD